MREWAPEFGRSVGRQYSYFLHWSHILLFRYVMNVAREEWKYIEHCHTLHCQPT